MCSKIFHKIVNGGQLNGGIKRLLIDGATCENEEHIKDHIVSFLGNMYCEEVVDRPFFEDLTLGSVDEEGSSRLESDLTETENIEAHNALSEEKSPGLYGFPTAFYQRMWGFMKTKIMAVVKEFQDHAYLDWRLNTTFVTLVSKIEEKK